MKINSCTSVVGNKVLLVPYKKKHVPKYHKWMQRKELQDATASEPLTEEEEYQMQKTWHDDENKCTFIVLDKNAAVTTQNEIAMIGDANLYLSTMENVLCAECGIMIAEDSQRGQGKGFEALTLLLKYGFDSLKIQNFVAKINSTNQRSINLFQKAGFDIIGENAVFSEVTLSVEVTNDWKCWLNRTIDCYSIETYKEH